jgi:hypothetical protein
MRNCLSVFLRAVRDFLAAYLRAPLTYHVETYCGVTAGWQPVTAAPLNAETAARRLRAFRAVRGHVRLFRLAAAS